MSFPRSRSSSIYSDDFPSEGGGPALPLLLGAAVSDTPMLPVLCEAAGTTPPPARRSNGKGGALMAVGGTTTGESAATRSELSPVPRSSAVSTSLSMSLSVGPVTTDLGLSTSYNDPIATVTPVDQLGIPTPTAMDELEFTGDVGESGSLLDGEKLDGPQEVNHLNYIVAHLPSCIGDRELYKMFEPFGALQRATVIVGNESQSRGFGFVTFEEAADGEKAMAEMNGKEMYGKTIRLLLSEHVYVPVTSKAIWVRNFPVYVTSEQLVKIFGAFGTLVNLHDQIKWSSSGKRRNKFQIVRVEYESVAIARTVIDALHGVREVTGGLSEPLTLPLKLVVRFYSEKRDKPRLITSETARNVTPIQSNPATSQSVSPTSGSTVDVNVAGRVGDTMFPSTTQSVSPIPAIHRQTKGKSTHAADVGLATSSSPTGGIPGSNAAAHHDATPSLRRLPQSALWAREESPGGENVIVRPQPINSRRDLPPTTRPGPAPLWVSHPQQAPVGPPQYMTMPTTRPVAAMMPAVPSAPQMLVAMDGSSLSPVRFVDDMDASASPPNPTAAYSPQPMPYVGTGTDMVLMSPPRSSPPMMMSSQAGPHAVQPQYYQTTMPQLQPIATQPQPQLVSYGGTVPPGMMQLAPTQQPVYTYLAYVGAPPQAPPQMPQGTAPPAPQMP